MRDDHGVDLRLGTPATGLDVSSREVRVGTQTIPYDALVIATGATPAGAGCRSLWSRRSFVMLYRRGERIVGALTIDRPSDIMNYRRRIANRGTWNEALRFAAGKPTGHP